MEINRPKETRFIRPKEAARIMGISVPTLYRWQEKHPDFPKKYRMGPNTVGYNSDDLYDYFQQKIQPVTQGKEDE